MTSPQTPNPEPMSVPPEQAVLETEQAPSVSLESSANASISVLAEGSTSNRYTCPMHPEVVTDKSGRCPLCGMNLVLKSEVGNDAVVVGVGSDRGLGVLTWRSYVPLLQITGGITLVALLFSALNGFSLAIFVVRFMTFFFLVFASFKLRDLKGFAEGYATYDLLASRVPAYGYVYPFIELSFGLAMLFGYHAHPLLWAEFFLMTFSGIGVAIKLARKEPFMCVCLGTSLKIPLTYVTLVEDFGMAGMALLLIYLL